ncbi:MAG: hypothetical protein R3E53_00465 [Myxococcota bacterium]
MTSISKCRSFSPAIRSVASEEDGVGPVARPVGHLPLRSPALEPDDLLDLAAEPGRDPVADARVLPRLASEGIVVEGLEESV